LDYVEVVQSLCDVLIESYRKLGQLKDTPVITSSSAKSLVPPVITVESDSSMPSVPPSTSETLLLEAVLKYDGQVQRVIESMVKQLDIIATDKIERELKLIQS
jgi:hypothetical protein